MKAFAGPNSYSYSIVLREDEYGGKLEVEETKGKFVMLHYT